MNTTRIGLPNFLPVNGTWALPFSVYFLLLQGRVVHLRLKNEQYMGERLFPGSATGKDHSNPDPLHLAIRSHSNFVENVPLAMLLAVVAELNGGSRKLLNYSMAALMLFRILHVELGMYGKNTLGPGRVVGHSGTQTWLVGMAAYSAYLVKGCWVLGYGMKSAMWALIAG